MKGERQREKGREGGSGEGAMDGGREREMVGCGESWMMGEREVKGKEERGIPHTSTHHFKIVPHTSTHHFKIVPHTSTHHFKIVPHTSTHHFRFVPNSSHHNPSL